MLTLHNWGINKNIKGQRALNFLKQCSFPFWMKCYLWAVQTQTIGSVDTPGHQHVTDNHVYPRYLLFQMPVTLHVHTLHLHWWVWKQFKHLKCLSQKPRMLFWEKKKSKKPKIANQINVTPRSHLHFPSDTRVLPHTLSSSTSQRRRHWSTAWFVPTGQDLPALTWAPGQRNKSGSGTYCLFNISVVRTQTSQLYIWL